MCTCKPASPGYREIADALRTGIRHGVYRPGDKLPKQKMIAETYGVNVNTVGLAIDLLEREGLVIQQRSHGTRILEPNPPRLHIVRHPESKPCFRPFSAACAELGVKGVTDLVSVDRLPTDLIVAKALDLEPGTGAIRRVNRMRITAPAKAAKVVQLQFTWLPLWVAEGTPLTGDVKVEGGIHLALTELGRFPARAVESVRAKVATNDEALELGLRPGSPVLESRRTTFTAHGEPIVHVHIVATEHVSFDYPQEL